MPSPRDGELLVVGRRVSPPGEWQLVGYQAATGQRLVVRPEPATLDQINDWGGGWLTVDGVRILGAWCWPHQVCAPPPGSGPVYELTPGDDGIVRVWRSRVPGGSGLTAAAVTAYEACLDE